MVSFQLPDIELLRFNRPCHITIFRLRNGSFLLLEDDFAKAVVLDLEVWLVMLIEGAVVGAARRPTFLPCDTTINF